MVMGVGRGQIAGFGRLRVVRLSVQDPNPEGGFAISDYLSGHSVDRVPEYHPAPLSIRQEENKSIQIRIVVDTGLLDHAAS
jgi:hypothetical protein